MHIYESAPNQNETMVASKFENRDNAKGFLVAFLKPFLVPPFMSLRQQ